MSKITFEDIKNNQDFKTYVKKADELLGTMGYTDHSSAHTLKVAFNSSKILTALGYSEREVELAKIAGFIHDIGNMINRYDHAQTGAIISFYILSELGMDSEEIALVTSAIGNHDEGTGRPVNPISAAIIISDKSDVRRSRVRNRDFTTFDIHDRVNYSVEKSELSIKEDERIISLDMRIDTSICSVMDYFELFLSRMVMCKRAAEFLETTFELVVNNIKLL